jgi:phosphoribosylanthranilate isomerase
VQLYPDWPAPEVADLRAAGPRILKVVSARPEENFSPDYEAVFGRYRDVVDGFLLDSSRAGGTGQTADWGHCARLVRLARRPVFLAGGLTADNVSSAIRTVRPFGVDVETGVSYRVPGGPLVKSLEKCRAFIDAVLRADRRALQRCDG